MAVTSARAAHTMACRCRAWSHGCHWEGSIEVTVKKDQVEEQVEADGWETMDVNFQQGVSDEVMTPTTKLERSKEIGQRDTRIS